jgi:TM2 domain-containing membrane protein YozV
MNCYQHSEVPAVAFCRTCGRALCAECKRTAFGTVYCPEHAPAEAPAAAAAPPAYANAPVADVSPGLAFVLGLIPGVGAIYNGQYGKGLIHAVITGLLISIMEASNGDGIGVVFGFLLVAWWLYMPLEAYHTAKKRQAGELVDEFSSIVNLRVSGEGFPTGAVVLIGVGVLLLLNTLDILRFRHLIRYWPVILIVMGVYMLYLRVSGAPRKENQP